MPTASGTLLPATITPAPSSTVVTTAILTPIPTAQPILSESGVLPPGAIARIPPLYDPEGLSSAKGKYYLSRSAQSFRVFDTETDEVLWSRYFGQRIYPSESPDERWVVASFSDTVYVWEIETGQLFRTFPNGEYRASFREWSPDSKLMVMRSEDLYPYSPPQSLVLWDPVTDEVVYQIDDQKMEIGDILWTQDNRLLITANYAHGQIENEIVIRDASTGERLRELALPLGGTGAGGKPLQASIANLHLSPDETKLAATYGHTAGDTAFVPRLTVLWDIQSGEKLFEFQAEGLWDTAFSPDGTRIALAQRSGYTEDTSIPIWDTSTGEQVLELIPPIEREGYAPVSDLKWSPNGSLIAGVVDHQVHLWEAATGTFLRTLEGSASHVNWSADGSKLYGNGREWDLVTGEITLDNPSAVQGVGQVNDLAWFSDGSGLAVIGDFQAQVWNVEDIRTELAVRELGISFDSGDAYTIAISPDQTTLATAHGVYYSYCSIDLWDAATSSHLLTIAEGDGFQHYDIAWSPDGNWLVASGDSVEVWEADSGGLRQEFDTDGAAIGVA